MILGTAGHIDHGKTALVMALTGVDTDRLPEEKRRGITIDLGFAPLKLDGVAAIGVVDVPGHEAFIRTMLAGATGVDMALLVVAADEGVMPQTREHLAILALLGVPIPVVALTKSDLVEEEWRAMVIEDVRAEVARTTREPCEVIAVSSRTGAGMAELRAAILGAVPASRRTEADLFRMPIDRVFSIRGTGTVVSGTVWSGSLDRDSSVSILPGAGASRVRRLESHGTAVARVGPGKRCAIALADVEVGKLRRGDTVVSGPGWCSTTTVTAEVTALPDFSGEIGSRTRFRFHLGTAEVGAHLRGSAPFPGAGGTSIVTIVLDAPIVARGGDRFVIRLPAPARTVGGGRVLDPLPPRRTRGKSIGGSGGGVESLVRAGAGHGVEVESLPLRTGLSPAEVSAELESLMSVVVIGGRAYDVCVVDGLAEGVVGRATRETVNDSLSPGVSIQTVKSEMGLSPALAEEVFRRAEKSGRVTLHGGIVAPTGWKPQPGADDLRIAEGMLHDICSSDIEPPSVGDLTEKFGRGAPGVLRFLEREGRLAQVEADRFYEVSVVTGLTDRLRRSMVPGRTYGPGDLKEILGFSRKYLIPFLEYCDRIGVTERRADGRVLRSAG